MTDLGAAELLWWGWVWGDHHHIVTGIPQVFDKGFKAVLHATDVAKRARLHEDSDLAGSEALARADSCCIPDHHAPLHWHPAGTA